MMKDDNNKAKLITLGIAALLIVIICGICFVTHALNKKDQDGGNSRLQSEILEYANDTQSRETKEAADEKEVKKENGSTPDAAPPQEQQKPEVTEAEAPEGESAVVVEQAPAQPAEQETAKSSPVTNVKWQRDVSENLSQVEIDLPRQMSEMKGYWEAGNMEAVEDLAYLPRYRAASKKLEGTTKFYYYGDTDGDNRPNGIGLASYADNQYYFGEWADGVRSGNGMWIKYYVYDRNAKAADSLYQQHSYSGSWAGDLPNGEGAEHYDLIYENLEAEAGYNSNFIGSFKDGLYHGEMYITNFYGNGNTKEWSGTAKNGVWKALGEKDKKGQYPVIFEITDPDNYQWMAEKDNKKHGVDGLLSAAWK